MEIADLSVAGAEQGGRRFHATRSRPERMDFGGGWPRSPSRVPRDRGRAGTQPSQLRSTRGSPPVGNGLGRSTQRRSNHRGARRKKPFRAGRPEKAGALTFPASRAYRERKQEPTGPWFWGKVTRNGRSQLHKTGVGYLCFYQRVIEGGSFPHVPTRDIVPSGRDLGTSANHNCG